MFLRKKRKRRGRYSGINTEARKIARAFWDAPLARVARTQAIREIKKKTKAHGWKKHEQKILLRPHWSRMRARRITEIQPRIHARDRSRLPSPEDRSKGAITFSVGWTPTIPMPNRSACEGRFRECGEAMTTQRKPKAPTPRGISKMETTAPTPHEVDQGGRVFYVENGKVYEGRKHAYLQFCTGCAFAQRRLRGGCGEALEACGDYRHDMGSRTLHPVQAVG